MVYTDVNLKTSFEKKVFINLTITIKHTKIRFLSPSWPNQQTDSLDIGF